MYKSRLLIAVVVAVFLLLLVPVFALVVGISLFPSLGTTSYSLVDFLTMPSTSSLVESTLEFSIVSAIFTTIFAMFYAWFIARTDVYGKRFLELLPVLGLSVPLLFKAFAWSFLLNRNSGIINTILNEILGRGVLNFNVNTMGGMIFVQSFTNIPLAYLVILPAMKSMDANLEEASRIAGRGILTTFRDVTFPIVRPAVFSAFVLAVIGGVGTLEYPFVLGIPGQIHVLATEVLFWAQERVPPAYGTAGEFSILYAIITIVAVTIYIWSTRRAFKFQVVTGRSVSQSAQKLGRLKYVALLICFAIVFFEFILPFLTLFLMSTSNIYGNGLDALKFNFPTSYVDALADPRLVLVPPDFGPVRADRRDASDRRRVAAVLRCIQGQVAGCQVCRVHLGGAARLPRSRLRRRPLLDLPPRPRAQHHLRDDLASRDLARLHPAPILDEDNLGKHGPGLHRA